MGCGCANNSWGRPEQHDGCGCGHRPHVNPCMEKARALRARIEELEHILACTSQSLSKACMELEALEREFDNFVREGCVKDIHPRGPEGCGCNCGSPCKCPAPRPQPRCGCPK